jgi:hypothetical protein
MSSVIFIHGTGVRGKDYDESFDLIRRELDRRARGWTAIECRWGDKHGVKLHLQGKSVPDYPNKPAECDELMRWWRLHQDPLSELRELAAMEEGREYVAPGQQAAWKTLDQAIRAYKPKADATALLDECGLAAHWDEAAREVVASDEYRDAVERSGSHPGYFRRAFARAVYARAVARISVAPPGDMRDRLIAAVVRELGGEDAGVRDLGKAALGGLKSVWNIFKANLGATAAYTGVLSRGTITDKSLPAAGDILLYQARGEKIKQFIKAAIESAPPPVYLLAHSLGGIACVDLLVEEPLGVAGLVTAGSQAPLLYEMNALVSLADGALLPRHFPRWLNFYDPNDLLSYKAEAVFPKRADGAANPVRDFEVRSRQPFPQSHGAYWRESKLWEEITRFLASSR